MPPPSERPQARVLALISQLLRRPTHTDRRLPLMWLSGRDGGTRVLGALVEKFKRPARYQVPHAHVDMNVEDAPHDIRQLLRQLCAQLTAPRFGGERLSFRHYELVDWLMEQDLSRETPGDRPKSGCRASSRSPSTVSTRQRQRRQQHAGPGTTLPASHLAGSASNAGGAFPHRSIGQNSRFRAPISVVHAPAVPGAITVGELSGFRRAAHCGCSAV
jgi:hypothetical protein